MTAGPDEIRGRVLGGRYRIGAVLGRGGMGTVYEAVQENLGRTVAVKVLHPLLAHDADTVARFRKEAEQAGALSHPHIVHVLDFGAEPGGPAWIAMEKLEGESLGQRLAKTAALEVQDAVPIALETLSALQAAHEARLVHRDLKPDNIFLAQAAGVGQVVKVLDFGIAKLLDGGAAAALTATGMVVGTPLYMSPEQAQGKVIDGRADLYSLGAVLFETLSGRPPFRADSYTALLIAIVTEPVPSLLAQRPDLDPRLAAVVDRAMSKDPSLRFATAHAMAEALRAVPLPPRGAGARLPALHATELGLAKTVEGAATPPPAPPSAPVAAKGRGPLVKLRWPKTALGTIVVVVLATFSWVGLQSTSPMSGGGGSPGMTTPVPPMLPGTPMTPVGVSPGATRAQPPPSPPLTAPIGPGSPGAPVGPGPGALAKHPRPPLSHVHLRLGSTRSPDVPDVRTTLAALHDVSSCWPEGEEAPAQNRGRCVDVSVSASGQVTDVHWRAGQEALGRCLASRIRPLHFQAPTTGRPASLQVCFTAQPTLLVR